MITNKKGSSPQNSRHPPQLYSVDRAEKPRQRPNKRNRYSFIERQRFEQIIRYIEPQEATEATRNGIYKATKSHKRLFT